MIDTDCMFYFPRTGSHTIDRHTHVRKCNMGNTLHEHRFTRIQVYDVCIVHITPTYILTSYTTCISMSILLYYIYFYYFM